MDLQLSMEEVNDLLFRAKHGASAVQSPGKKQIVAMDLGGSEELSDERRHTITTLHQTLAQRMSESLSGFFRKTVQMKMELVEQKSFGEFLKGVPDPTYIASVAVASMAGQRIFLQADTALVFPFVDIILGGTGTDPIESRDLTEIEEELFESIGEIVARELQATWCKALEVKLKFEQRRTPAPGVNLMPQVERVLCLTFSIVLQEQEGKLRLVLPSAVSDALSKKIAVTIPSSEPVKAHKNDAHMKELMLDSRFTASMMLPISQVSVKEVFNLKAGSVVALGVRATDLVQVDIAGQSMFLAAPVRFGSMRGAQIQQVLSIAPKEKRNKQ